MATDDWLRYGSLALGGSLGRTICCGPSASVTMLSFYRSLQIVALERRFTQRALLAAEEFH